MRKDIPLRLREKYFAPLKKFEDSFDYSNEKWYRKGLLKHSDGFRRALLKYDPVKVFLMLAGLYPYTRCELDDLIKEQVSKEGYPVWDPHQHPNYFPHGWLGEGNFSIPENKYMGHRRGFHVVGSSPHFNLHDLGRTVKLDKLFNEWLIKNNKDPIIATYAVEVKCKSDCNVNTSIINSPDGPWSKNPYTDDLIQRVLKYYPIEKIGNKLKSHHVMCCIWGVNEGNADFLGVLSKILGNGKYTMAQLLKIEDKVNNGDKIINGVPLPERVRQGIYITFWAVHPDTSVYNNWFTRGISRFFSRGIDLESIINLYDMGYFFQAIEVTNASTLLRKSNLADIFNTAKIGGSDNHGDNGGLAYTILKRPKHKINSDLDVFDCIVNKQTDTNYFKGYSNLQTLIRFTRRFTNLFSVVKFPLWALSERHGEDHGVFKKSLKPDRIYRRLDLDPYLSELKNCHDKFIRFNGKMMSLSQYFEFTKQGLDKSIRDGMAKKRVRYQERELINKAYIMADNLKQGLKDFCFNLEDCVVA